MQTATAAFKACFAMMRDRLADAPEKRVEDAALYLAHVEASASLRRLAEAAGKAPASVHRAVRRIEALRDDPLIDRALDALGGAARAAFAGEDAGLGADDGVKAAPATDFSETDFQESDMAYPAVAESSDERAGAPSDYALRVAAQALGRLSEPESFLMVAKGATKAGVFCRKNKFRRPLGLLTIDAAADLAARDWVRCVSRTSMSAKYVISETGRAWLRRRRAEEAAQAAPIVGAAPGPFAAQHMVPGERQVARRDGGVDVIRVNLGESPLGWLATRKGPNGDPFLTQAEVEAGERLRADYELAHMGPRVTQDWRSFLAPAEGRPQPSGPAEGPTFARDRVGRALSALGPGLADVALRACCLLEGLEATERRMGWSARSGKVVLKIALQRLADHYGIAQEAGRRDG